MLATVASKVCVLFDLKKLFQFLSWGTNPVISEKFQKNAVYGIRSEI